MVNDTFALLPTIFFYKERERRVSNQWPGFGIGLAAGLHYKIGGSGKQFLLIMQTKCPGIVSRAVQKSTNKKGGSCGFLPWVSVGPDAHCQARQADSLISDPTSAKSGARVRGDTTRLISHTAIQLPLPICSSLTGTWFFVRVGWMRRRRPRLRTQEITISS